MLNRGSVFFLFIASALLAGCVSPDEAPEQVAQPSWFDVPGSEEWFAVVDSTDAHMILHERLLSDYGPPTDSVIRLDGNGFVHDMAILCEAKTAEGDCAFGGVHSYQIHSRGMPYQCGAFLRWEAPRSYVTYAADGGELVTNVTQVGDKLHVRTARANDGELLWECTIEVDAGRLERMHVTRMNGVDIDHRMVPSRQGGNLQRPFTDISTGALGPMAMEGPGLETYPGLPEGARVPTAEAVAELDRRGVRFQDFKAENGGDPQLIGTHFSWSGGSTVGPPDFPVLETNSYDRTLTFYGATTKTYLRATVSASDQPWASSAEFWTIEEEVPSAPEGSWGQPREDDLMMAPASTTLTDVNQTFKTLEVAGQFVSAEYRPSYASPFNRPYEIDQVDACMTRLDPSESFEGEGAAGSRILYTHSICVATGTGQPTYVRASWPVIQALADFEDPGWAERIEWQGP